MAERQKAGERCAYKVFRQVGTRWNDNDTYGHMNNAVHYSLFDTAVNGFLIDNGLLDIKGGSEVFLVAETGCRYHAEMTFPDVISVGLRIGRLGTSSVKYEIGLFRNDETTAAAEGFFVHVNVGRATRQPVPFNDAIRGLLEPLVVRA